MYDLRTGVVLDEIQPLNVTVRSALGQPQRCDITVALAASGSFCAPTPVGTVEQVPVPSSPQDLFQPATNGVIVERHGTPIFAGPIWGLNLSVAANTIRLACEDATSLLWRMTRPTTWDWAGSVGEAVTDLLDAFKGVGGTYQHLDVTELTPGNFVFWTALGSERHTYGDLVSAVCEAGEVVWRTTHTTDPVSTSIVLVSAWRPDTTAVFEVGANIEVLDVTLDGTTIANQVVTRGQSAGAVTIEGVAWAPSDVAARPLLESVVDASHLRTAVGVQLEADRLLAERLTASGAMSVTVDIDATPRFGSYQIGDLVEVRGAYGGFSFDSVRTVTSMTYAATEDTETVDLELSEQQT